MKNILDNIDQKVEIIYVPAGTLAPRLTESEFVSHALHCQYISELSDGIVYTRQTDDKPYVIETHPELGAFATWDDAYDVLIDHIHSEDDPREIQEMEANYARLMTELDDLLEDFEDPDLADSDLVDSDPIDPTEN